MLKSFKLIVSVVIILISGINAFAQDEVEYKDVILDGKPAKLNIKTGEITLVDTEGIVKVKSSKKSEGSETDSSFSSSDFHIVKEGETLLMIANSYNATLAALKKANNLETTLINKGQWLRVRNLHKAPVKAIPQPAYSPNSSNLSNSTISTISSNTSNFHIVEKGQTLYSLAKQYNLSVSQLKSYNGLSSNLIKVGQQLKLSSDNPYVEVGHNSVWTVSKGDTLYSIAKKNGTTVSVIKSMNGLTSNLIKVGQKLQLQ